MSTDPDRDPALDALWREHSTETPPPHVDATIVAAAHRAAASSPRGRERWVGPRAWRWWMPLAAAAVIAVVVVGVKPPSQMMVDDATQSASDMSAASEKQSTAPGPEPKVDAVRAPEPKIAAARAPEPKIAAAPSEQSGAAAKEERAKSVETPPRAENDGSARQSAAERAERFASPPPAAAARMMAAPARPALPDARADGGAALSADDWIARIRALRERGAQDDALRELARFRDAFADADARLPDDLRAWAKPLPR